MELRIVCCVIVLFFLMIRRPPRSTRTDTLFPYTTLFRSILQLGFQLPSLARLGLLPRPRWGVAHAGVRRIMKLIGRDGRSEEHTSELQSLMRISYAVFCLYNNTSQEPP